MTETPTGYGGQTKPLPELKPCPFCGIYLAVTWHIGHNLPKPWTVNCYGCGAEGPRGTTEREAIELWNRRMM